MRSGNAERQGTTKRGCKAETQGGKAKREGKCTNAKAKQKAESQGNLSVESLSMLIKPRKCKITYASRRCTDQWSQQRRAAIRSDKIRVCQLRCGLNNMSQHRPLVSTATPHMHKFAFAQVFIR